DYLKAQRGEVHRVGRPFDTAGLVLLALAMVSWEVLLSKGQEWDWFGDPFYRVQTLAAIFIVALGALIRRALRITAPLINFRTLPVRYFRPCWVILCSAFGVL